MRRLALVVIVAAGCSRGVEVGPAAYATVEPEAETGTDAGADAHADADAGADTEAAADTEADAVADSVINSGGEPTIVGSVAKARDIAVGGGFVFVTSFDGAIFRLPVSGGVATKIALPEWPTYVAVDSTHVYWTDLAKPPNTGSVGRVAIGGGMTELLATGLAGPNSCTLFGDRVYFAHGTTGGRVESVPVAGGSAATVADAVTAPYYVAANSARVCWAAGGTSIACSVGGTLVSGEAARINFLALDDTHAYFALRSGVLRRVPLAGGSPVTIDTGADSTLGAEIVLDGGDVYWSSGGQIRRVAKSASSGTALYAGAGYVQGIAVDATHVYWTTAGDTQIRKLRK